MVSHGFKVFRGGFSSCLEVRSPKVPHLAALEQGTLNFDCSCEDPLDGCKANSNGLSFPFNRVGVTENFLDVVGVFKSGTVHDCVQRACNGLMFAFFPGPGRSQKQG